MSLMISMLVFGDIFSYGDNLYVYLDMDEDTVYAARILTKHDSQRVVRGRDDSLKKRGEKATRPFAIYCFVQLTTDGYEDQVAHLNQTQTQKEPNRFLHTDGDRICKADMLELRKEIMEGPVPGALKISVAKLDLDSLPD
jgi:hypothetical protein